MGGYAGLKRKQQTGDWSPKIAIILKGVQS